MPLSPYIIHYMIILNYTLGSSCFNLTLLGYLWEKSGYLKLKAKKELKMRSIFIQPCQPCYVNHVNHDDYVNPVNHMNYVNHINHVNHVNHTNCINHINDVIHVREEGWA